MHKDTRLDRAFRLSKPVRLRRTPTDPPTARPHLRRPPRRITSGATRALVSADPLTRRTLRVPALQTRRAGLREAPDRAPSPGNACSTQPRPTFLRRTAPSAEAQGSGDPRPPVVRAAPPSPARRARPRAVPHPTRRLSRPPLWGLRPLQAAAGRQLGSAARGAPAARAPVLRPRVRPLAAPLRAASAPAAGAASGKKPAGPGAGRGLSTRTARARQAPAQALGAPSRRVSTARVPTASEAEAGGERLPPAPFRAGLVP